MACTIEFSLIDGEQVIIEVDLTQDGTNDSFIHDLNKLITDKNDNSDEWLTIDKFVKALVKSKMQYSITQIPSSVPSDVKNMTLSAKVTLSKSNVKHDRFKDLLTTLGNITSDQAEAVMANIDEDTVVNISFEASNNDNSKKNIHGEFKQKDNNIDIVIYKNKKPTNIHNTRRTLNHELQHVVTFNSPSVINFDKDKVFVEKLITGKLRFHDKKLQGILDAYRSQIHSFNFDSSSSQEEILSIIYSFLMSEFYANYFQIHGESFDYNKIDFTNHNLYEENNDIDEESHDQLLKEFYDKAHKNENERIQASIQSEFLTTEEVDTVYSILTKDTEILTKEKVNESGMFHKFQSTSLSLEDIQKYTEAFRKAYDINNQSNEGIFSITESSLAAYQQEKDSYIAKCKYNFKIQNSFIAPSTLRNGDVIRYKSNNNKEYQAVIVGSFKLNGLIKYTIKYKDQDGKDVYSSCYSTQITGFWKLIKDGKEAYIKTKSANDNETSKQIVNKGFEKLNFETKESNSINKAKDLLSAKSKKKNSDKTSINDSEGRILLSQNDDLTINYNGNTFSKVYKNTLLLENDIIIVNENGMQVPYIYYSETKNNNMVIAAFKDKDGTIKFNLIKKSDVVSVVTTERIVPLLERNTVVSEALSNGESAFLKLDSSTNPTYKGFNSAINFDLTKKLKSDDTINVFTDGIALLNYVKSNFGNDKKTLKSLLEFIEINDINDKIEFLQNAGRNDEAIKLSATHAKQLKKFKDIKEALQNINTDFKSKRYKIQGDRNSGLEEYNLTIYDLITSVKSSFNKINNKIFEHKNGRSLVRVSYFDEQGVVKSTNGVFRRVNGDYLEIIIEKEVQGSIQETIIYVEKDPKTIIKSLLYPDGHVNKPKEKQPFITAVYEDNHVDYITMLNAEKREEIIERYFSLLASSGNNAKNKETAIMLRRRYPFLKNIGSDYVNTPIVTNNNSPLLFKSHEKANASSKISVAFDNKIDSKKTTKPTTKEKASNKTVEEQENDAIKQFEKDALELAKLLNLNNEVEQIHEGPSKITEEELASVSQEEVTAYHSAFGRRSHDLVFNYIDAMKSILNKNEKDVSVDHLTISRYMSNISSLPIGTRVQIQSVYNIDRDKYIENEDSLSDENFINPLEGENADIDDSDNSILTSDTKGNNKVDVVFTSWATISGYDSNGIPILVYPVKRKSKDGRVFMAGVSKRRLNINNSMIVSAKIPINAVGSPTKAALNEASFEYGKSKAKVLFNERTPEFVLRDQIATTVTKLYFKENHNKENDNKNTNRHEFDDFFKKTIGLTREELNAKKDGKYLHDIPEGVLSQIDAVKLNGFSSNSLIFNSRKTWNYHSQTEIKGFIENIDGKLDYITKEANAFEKVIQYIQLAIEDPTFNDSNIRELLIKLRTENNSLYSILSDYILRAKSVGNSEFKKKALLNDIKLFVDKKIEYKDNLVKSKDKLQEINDKFSDHAKHKINVLSVDKKINPLHNSSEYSNIKLDQYISKFNSKNNITDNDPSAAMFSFFKNIEQKGTVLRISPNPNSDYVEDYMYLGQYSDKEGAVIGVTLVPVKSLSNSDALNSGVISVPFNKFGPNKKYNILSMNIIKERTEKSVALNSRANVTFEQQRKGEFYDGALRYNNKDIIKAKVKYDSVNNEFVNYSFKDGKTTSKTIVYSKRDNINPNKMLDDMGNQALIVVAKNLQTMYGLNISIMTEDDIAYIYGKHASKQKAFKIDGGIILNRKYADMGSPIHELGHFVLEAIKNTPEYDEIIAFAKSQTKEVERIKELYKEENLSEMELLEEVFLNMLGDYVQDRATSKPIEKEKDGFFTSIFKLFKSFFGKILGVDNEIVNFDPAAIAAQSPISILQNFSNKIETGHFIDLVKSQVDPKIKEMIDYFFEKGMISKYC